MPHHRHAAVTALTVLAAASSPLGHGASQTSPLRPGETRFVDVRPRPFEPPGGAPSVAVHAAPAFDPTTPLDLVVFLHGWHGCTRAILASSPTRCRAGDRPTEGLAVASAFDASERPALLVVPQLAWRARSGSPGRFRERGLAREWLASTLARVGLRGRSIARITVAAHSAGFKSAITMLDRGDLPDRPTDVVLLDALYARSYDFARWTLARADRRLVVVHGDSTARETRRLRRWMQRNDGARITLRRTTVPHARVPAEELADVLRALR